MGRYKGWRKAYVSADGVVLGDNDVEYVSRRTGMRLIVYKSGNGWKCSGQAGYEPSTKLIAKKRCMQYMKSHPNG